MYLPKLGTKVQHYFYLKFIFLLYFVIMSTLTIDYTHKCYMHIQFCLIFIKKQPVYHSLRKSVLENDMRVVYKTLYYGIPRCFAHQRVFAALGCSYLSLIFFKIVVSVTVTIAVTIAITITTILAAYIRSTI